MTWSQSSNVDRRVRCPVDHGRGNVLTRCRYHAKITLTEVVIASMPAGTFPCVAMIWTSLSAELSDSGVMVTSVDALAVNQ